LAVTALNQLADGRVNGVEIEYMKKESYDFFIYSLSLKLVLEVD